MNVDVAVIGGGITGLTAAYWLEQMGRSVAVFERDEEVGGKIQTVDSGGYRVELGPTTLMNKRREVDWLLSELDLTRKIRTANRSAKRRYILRDGHPVQLPSDPRAFFSSPFLSTPAKFELVMRAILPLSAPSGDETVRQFAVRNLGREAYEYMVDPFISGIWAGDPEKLLAREVFDSVWRMERDHGSVAAGAIAEAVSSALKPPKRRTGTRGNLISFDGGLAQIIRQLQTRIQGPLHLGAEVTEISRHELGWAIQTGHGGPKDSETTVSAVVSTVSAPNIPDMLTSELVEQTGTAKLRRFPHASVGVVALGYSNDAFGRVPDGFGILMPGIEDRGILGALFGSNIFEGRAPANSTLVKCFIGGRRNPSAIELSDPKLTRRAIAELDDLFGIEAPPDSALCHRWRDAIPQYETDYDAYIDAVESLRAETDGLFVAGSLEGGPALPDRIADGIQTARQTDRHFADL